MKCLARHRKLTTRPNISQLLDYSNAKETLIIEIVKNPVGKLKSHSFKTLVTVTGVTYTVIR